MGVQATGPGQGLWGLSQVRLSGPFFWPVGWMTCPRRKQGFHGRRPAEVICRWLLWGGRFGGGWLEAPSRLCPGEAGQSKVAPGFALCFSGRGGHGGAPGLHSTLHPCSPCPQPTAHRHQAVASGPSCLTAEPGTGSRLPHPPSLHGAQERWVGSGQPHLLPHGGAGIQGGLHFPGGLGGGVQLPHLLAPWVTGLQRWGS